MAYSLSLILALILTISSFSPSLKAQPLTGDLTNHSFYQEAASMCIPGNLTLSMTNYQYRLGIEAAGRGFWEGLIRMIDVSRTAKMDHATEERLNSYYFWLAVQDCFGTEQGGPIIAELLMYEIIFANAITRGLTVGGTIFGLSRLLSMSIAGFKNLPYIKPLVLKYPKLFTRFTFYSTYIAYKIMDKTINSIKETSRSDDIKIHLVQLHERYKELEEDARNCQDIKTCTSIEKTLSEFELRIQESQEELKALEIHPTP